ncbi:LytR/AlgR family response regulator transcription factor [Larkinella rosea]|uniref:DNA-binding response regulator n=1 Tax=Larkinella rosea TaxID=2025312 RepID=A0A3P1C2D7_9BACT|nr:LytTR family DNA-binding domain-containing protein [Larkinella rosea]RRB07545.1 DNA-binding response regulator [Larkinella rosea]
MMILLIEDELLVAKTLARLVRQLEPEAHLEGPLESVRSAVAWFEHHRASDLPDPDLILSDIQLSDGVSFDIYREINPQCPIIFTTAYDEYAIRAFKLNSIDYLLKPIEPEELKTAFDKYHRWKQGGNSTHFRDQLRDLLADMSVPSKKYKHRFTAHYLRNIVPVNENNVAYFCRDELIYLYTMDGQKLVTDYGSLDELEELTDPAVFIRANRQCLVNQNAIAGYQSHYSGKLVVTLKKPVDSELTISKEKAAVFREWFEQG